MTSGRVLGKGRVLGGSRSPLAPPQPPASPAAGAASAQRSQHKRNTSYLSPSSDSSASLTSLVSGSTAQDTAARPHLRSGQDLAANVSLELPDNAATANASSRLICPICSEQMVGVIHIWERRL